MSGKHYKRKENVSKQKRNKFTRYTRIVETANYFKIAN